MNEKQANRSICLFLRLLKTWIYVHFHQNMTDIYGIFDYFELRIL